MRFGEQHGHRVGRAPGPLARWAAAAVFGWGLAGCPSAETVPFKHDDSPPPQDDTDPDTPPADDDAPDAEARSHDGGPVLSLPGGDLELPGARASLRLPLDDDDTPDVLVWAGDTAQGFALWRALGGAEGYGEPRPIDRSALSLPEGAPGCDVARATLSPLGAEKAALRVTLDCPDPQPDAPHEHVWVLGLSSSPRVLEHFTLRLGTQQAPLELAAVEPSDVDGDHHDDVQLLLRSSAAAADVTLTWLDRPSGLARDTSEPEASLAALAAEAEKQLSAGDAAGAAAAASRVTSVHRQLCREGGEPQLGVAGTWGLRCGSSAALARAMLVALSARAAEGDVLGAFEAFDALERSGAKVDAKARARALKALSDAAETPDYRLLPLASVALPAQAALPPSVRWVGDVLWAGSQPPRIWDANTRGELSSLDAPVLPTSFQDPSGHYHVRHIDRDCEGRLLRIASDGGATERARIRDEPRDDACALRLPVPDAGDLRVLGWAPQGVVLADREGAVLVPLDARARPTEPPRRIAPETPLPAPLPEGRATPDGQCYVLPSPHGLLLRRHGRDAQARLLRPPGWSELPGSVRDAAVDARCERFAIATSSQVVLLLPRDGGGGQGAEALGQPAVRE